MSAALPAPALPSPVRTPARRSSAALGTLGALLVLVLWELCARFVWKDAQVLPAPSQAIADAYRQLTLAELAQHVGWSLWRIVAGFAVGAVAGVGLGVAGGWYRGLARIARPIVELLRPIPPLAWIPIAIVWFGLGEASKIFVIFLGAFFPIFTNAWRGMVSVPPVLLAAARTMDIEGPALLFKVALPAALPDIATGLRVGFGLSFGILVAAELIAAERGMGFLVMQSRQVGQLGVAIFAILLIGVVTLLADGVLAAALRHLLGHRARAR
jgi:ABC-type nitrate/sulfonate/bicarbonate transport system permease component